MEIFTHTLYFFSQEVTRYCTGAFCLSEPCLIFDNIIGG